MRILASALLIIGYHVSTTAWATQPTGFVDAPIACGEGIAYSDCRASFNGWALTIIYKTADGRASEAYYRQCAVIGELLSCSAGAWRNGKLSGALPARMIGLHNGKPFAK